jgi:DNA-directed RNA polymerase subunit H (RpoH/RPB5)
MLSNRIYIDKKGEKHQLLDQRDTLKNIEERGDGTFTFKANNGDNYAVKIIFQKITAIGKQSVISDFFNEYAKFRKIIVAKDFNNKIADHVARQHTQIFKENSMLEDIISHKYQPKYELLTPAEMDKVKSEYNATDYSIQKMMRSDPITKYFALKKGDIIRIIRPSPTSGEAIAYRIVN